MKELKQILDLVGKLDTTKYSLDKTTGCQMDDDRPVFPSRTWIRNLDELIRSRLVPYSDYQRKSIVYHALWASEEGRQWWRQHVNTALGANHVVSASTVAASYDELVRLFVQTTVPIHAYKVERRAIEWPTQREGETIEQYTMYVKGLATDLEEVGRAIDFEELLEYYLRGLQIQSVANIVRTRYGDRPTTLLEAKNMVNHFLEVNRLQRMGRDAKKPVEKKKPRFTAALAVATEREVRRKDGPIRKEAWYGVPPYATQGVCFRCNSSIPHAHFARNCTNSPCEEYRRWMTGQKQQGARKQAPKFGAKARMDVASKKTSAAAVLVRYTPSESLTATIPTACTEHSGVEFPQEAGNEMDTWVPGCVIVPRHYAIKTHSNSNLSHLIGSDGKFLDDPQRDPSGSLNVQWTLWVELDNTTTKALVDSGSGESLVTQELLKKNPSIEKRPASTRWFQGAWGEYQSNMIAVIPFTAGGTQWVVHAYICDELPYHLILGSRFITGYGWQLDGDVVASRWEIGT